jgi:hypothetical protein
MKFQQPVKTTTQQLKVNKMKAIYSTCLITAMLLALVIPCSADETLDSKPEVLADGAKAEHKRVDNMHGTRFIEIFLATKDSETGDFVAPCYNTMFMPEGIPASKDTAPQAEVAALDFKKIAKEYNVLGASLNGPKLWLPDWAEVETGKIRKFDAIQAPWVAQLNMGDKLEGVSESTPYKPTSIARKSRLGWNKGTTALLLDSPDGTTWIMKGFELGLEPKHTYDEFISKGAAMFQKLPEGWKVRVVTLEKDLIEKPEGGVAWIMPDEFFNIYDKTGPGMTNYKP